MKKVLTLALFLFIMGNIMAQDFKQDLITMSKLYLGLDKFKITAQVENLAQNGTISKNKYEVWKWSEQFLQKNKEYEVLLNDKFMVILTQQDKHISYAYAEDIPENETSELLKKADFNKIVDSYFEKYDSVKFNGLVDGIKYYRIYSNDFDAKWLDISFDKKTYHINKLVYFYDEDKSFSTLSRMTISFKFEALNSYPQSSFNHNIYLNVKANKIIPSSKYQSFSISQKNYFSR